MVLPPGFPSARCHPSITRSLGSRISPSDSPIIPNFLRARARLTNTENNKNPPTPYDASLERINRLPLKEIAKEELSVGYEL
jgi:hypothetical protein